MERYREILIETLENLIDAREDIFTKIVNLAMTNEYEHLQKFFEEGDSYEFYINHFEDMKDENVQILVNLYKNLEKNIEEIRLKNQISEEDLYNNPYQDEDDF